MTIAQAISEGIQGERVGSRNYGVGTYSVRRRARDREVARLRNQGYTVADIADTMQITVDQVRTSMAASDSKPRVRKSSWNVNTPEGALEECRADEIAIQESALPDGIMGYIAYIDDRPGLACHSVKDAIRSAVAAYPR